MAPQLLARGRDRGHTPPFLKKGEQPRVLEFVRVQALIYRLWNNQQVFFVIAGHIFFSTGTALSAFERTPGVTF